MPFHYGGIVNIYKILITPNGTVFTSCQVVMSIESGQNLISPLFLGVDQSPEGEVVVTCNQSMEEGTEALLSHFGIYLAYRTSIKAF